MMELAFFTVCGLEVFVGLDKVTTGPFLEWKREGSALLLWLGKVHVVLDRRRAVQAMG